MTRREMAMKRALDMTVAGGGLLLLWPVILVAWYLARRDTGASGFYAQERIGRGGRRFRLFKLRTMRPVQGTTVTTRTDPRITPLGARLRRLKLDELPQLWNVLRGDMSLVGPRPDVPGFMDLLEGDDRAILRLRPGITGPATLKYRDEEEILNSVPAPEEHNALVIWPDKVRINREYLENWSLRQDIRYLLQTLRPVSSAASDHLPFTPVVIIGAARSGTNALRDALTRLPDFETWPCDEINPIWRHGNLFHPDDEIPAEDARPEVRRYIRRAFRRIWRQRGKPRFVVEKTCANSLRVPFVAAVLPEARFIHITRNGLDVVASARKRWRGELEMPGLPYVLAKARYAPLRDLPLYAWSFLKGRLRVAGHRGHVGTWGPRPAGMRGKDAAPLEELCAHQWARSVAKADAALAQQDPGRVLSMRYEKFVADPAATISAILEFLDARAEAEEIAAAASPVRSSSVGKGRALLPELGPGALEVMDPPLRAHGYGI